MKDGWHKIAGYAVMVEDGKILLGLVGGGAVYPYRRSGYHWTSCEGLTVAAFRAGVARGIIIML